MTSALVPVLAAKESVSWSRATVSAITGNTLTLNWQGTEVSNVPRLASYTPTVGDAVHLLVYGPAGILVLGNSLEDPPMVPPAPPAALLFEPAESATYTYKTGTWNTALAQQTSESAAVFRYATVAGAAVAVPSEFAVRLAVSEDSSRSVGLTLVSNDSLTGNISIVPGTEIKGLIPDAEQWINLPLSWARQLVSGAATGIALIAPANTESSVTVTGGTLKINQL